MARQWTQQQLKAINATGKLTVLSAAAGSGKTTVLVEKALRMLLDEENKTPADRLLIVTFSNASAKEFKKRIEKGINDAIKKNPENSYIKAQKIALQKADISTIHSFCIKLTRENFEALDIPPDFTICDDAKSMAIHSRAIDGAMEYGYTLPDFCSFVTLFGKSSQDKQIREFLKYMFYYFSALPFPEKRAQEIADMAQQTDFETTEVYRFLWQDIGEQIQYLDYLVARQKNLVWSGDVDGYAAGVAANGNVVNSLMQAYAADNVFLVKSIAKDGLGTLGRMKKGEASEWSEAVKGVNEKIKEVLKNIAEDAVYLDKDRWAEDTAQTSRYVKAITQVFLVYSKQLMEIKKAEKAFEFSDFEHFAVKLLVNPEGGRTPLAKALSEKYIKIMEDEFQDTSFVQDMIFKTLSHENESNLFVVGDVKQSIYGFRKASPQILLEKRSREAKDARLGQTIVLPNNFRSEVNVIRGVNRLFEQIMTKDLGGVDYREGEQLLPAPNKTESGKPGTEILIVTEKSGEAQVVADRIYTMVKEGYTITEGENTRKVGYGDFCILLRNKKRFEEFSQALEQRGIKAFVRDEQPLLEKEEIQSIIALLKVINNPLQEVYLTAGMFGDIFGFTLDDILRLKKNNKKENLYRLLSQSDSGRAKEFLEILQQLSFAAKIHSPDKLIDLIVNVTGYYTRLAFGADGGEKRENIRRFILFAKKYITDYQNSLGDFIRYIDLCTESGKGSTETVHQPANTVAVMTMHTSKGLEFPVCFVSGMGTAFNKMDRANRLMIDPVLGMATYANESFGYNRSTAGIHAIKKKVLKANADDEMRLLYVALTRAKNKNFITAQYTNVFTANTVEKIWQKTGARPSSYALQQANSPMEWIITGFIDHPQFTDGSACRVTEGERKVTFEKLDVDEKDITISVKQGYDNLIGLEYITPAEVCGVQQQQQHMEEIPFDVNRAQENLAACYGDMAKTKLPIKMSVGEIAKAVPQLTLKQPVFASEGGATAAERGTQMHLFAQHSDIVLARLDPEGQIDSLCQRGITDRSLLNKKQIETFLQSSVADIIVKADRLYKEKEFVVPYSAADALGDENYVGETVMVQGVIDCLAIIGDTAYVIDYKTDRVRDMDSLYRKYSKQLSLYRHAARYLYEVKDVKCIIYSFYLGESTQF